MAMFPDFLGRTLSHFQAIVEFAVACFDHGLMQIALGKITGRIVCRQCRRQRVCLLHRRFAIFSGGLDRSGGGAAKRRCAPRKAGEKTCDQLISSTQRCIRPVGK